MAEHKSGFEEGELVTMSDQENCEIIKLMSLSAKIKLPDGSFKIAPYSIFQKQGKQEATKAVTKKVTKKEAPKKVVKKEAPKKSSRRRGTGKNDMVVHREKVGEPIQQSFFDSTGEPKTKGASRRRPKKATTEKKAVRKVIEKEVVKKTEVVKHKEVYTTKKEAERRKKQEVHKAVQQGKTEEQRKAVKKAVKKGIKVITDNLIKKTAYKNKPDEAATYLAGTKSVNTLLTRMRKHPSFVAVNMNAFTTMKKQKDELSLATFKMRCLNMLRAAMRKV